MATSVFDILCDTEQTIGGFQFGINSTTNISVVTASGGAAAAVGFLVTATTETVLGFHLGGQNIEPSDLSGAGGVLVQLTVEYDGDAPTLCVDELVFSDPSGTPMEFEVASTNCLLVTDVDEEVYGCMDDMACNYNPDATSDDGSCYFVGPADASDCEGNCRFSIGHLVAAIGAVISTGATEGLARKNLLDYPGVTIHTPTSDSDSSIAIAYNTESAGFDVYGMHIQITGLPDDITITSAGFEGGSLPDTSITITASGDQVLVYSLAQSMMRRSDQINIGLSGPRGDFEISESNTNIAIIGDESAGFVDGTLVPFDLTDDGTINVLDVVAMVNIIATCPAFYGDLEASYSDSPPPTLAPLDSDNIMEWNVHSDLDDGSIVNIDNYSCNQPESFAVNAYAVHTMRHMEEWVPYLRQNKKADGSTVSDSNKLSDGSVSYFDHESRVTLEDKRGELNAFFNEHFEDM